MVLPPAAADALRQLWQYEIAELANFGRCAVLPGASSLPPSAPGAAVPVTLAVALLPLAFVFSRRTALSSLTTRPAPLSAVTAVLESARLPVRKALHSLRASRLAIVARIAAWLRVI